MNNIDRPICGQHLPQTTCRKCGERNAMAYLAPVRTYPDHTSSAITLSVICYDCADSRGWIDPSTGNLREGVTL